jgi:hypothetical protein
MLVLCDDCGKQISSDALHCPKCGAITQTNLRLWESHRRRGNVYRTLVVLGSFGAAFVVYLFSSDSEEGRRMAAAFTFVCAFLFGAVALGQNGYGFGQ